MKELFLDGAKWTTKDDVYDAFFRAVGARERCRCRSEERAGYAVPW